MNILPKKRWHVRTKDNIARVRKDEANARAEEQIRQQKLELAQSEVRINFLRRHSGFPELQKSTVAQQTALGNSETAKSFATNSEKHVGLFADYKTHIKTTNKELEKEKKEEQEKFEKQIGYLTYLGQDTNEALKLRSWYEVLPKRAAVGESQSIENDLKGKLPHDPLTLIKALLPPEKTTPASKQIKENKKISKKCQRSTPALPESNNFKKKGEHRSKHERKKEKPRKEERKKRLHHHIEKKQSREEELVQRKKDMMGQMRKERLRREAVERERQETLLAPKESATNHPYNAITPLATPRIQQKYNSQFNPELAKQNMI